MMNLYGVQHWWKKGTYLGSFYAKDLVNNKIMLCTPSTYSPEAIQKSCKCILLNLILTNNLDSNQSSSRQCAVRKVSFLLYINIWFTDSVNWSC